MPDQTTPADLPMTLTLRGGPTVGRLGFRAMRVTGPGVWGPPRDKSEAIALLRRLVDNGVTFIDTADGLVDICADAGIAFIPFYPLAKGRLAAPGSPLPRIAERHNATPAQIALAWLLHRSPAMRPIPGTSSIAHFEEDLGAASIRLSAEELRTLAAR